MNINLIKLWVNTVGIDEVLKSPMAMYLAVPAELWAEGRKEGLELKKSYLEASIAELSAKKVEIENKIINAI